MLGFRSVVDLSYRKFPENFVFVAFRGYESLRSGGEVVCFGFLCKLVWGRRPLRKFQEMLFCGL